MSNSTRSDVPNASPRIDAATRRQYVAADACGELKATYYLRRMGGRADNRNQLAKHYRTRNGHRSTALAYSAADRAIRAGEIVLSDDGSIRLADEEARETAIVGDLPASVNATAEEVPAPPAVPVFETRLAKIAEGGPGYGEPITGTSEACRIVWPYFADRFDCEEFAIVTLDTKHKVTGIVRITRGTLDASLVHPREIFRAAIAAGAAAVLLVHNHPSGDTTPSRGDRLVTDRLEKSGELIGITVLDHLIVANGRCLSLREGGAA